MFRILSTIVIVALIIVLTILSIKYYNKVKEAKKIISDFNAGVKESEAATVATPLQKVAAPSVFTPNLNPSDPGNLKKWSNY